MNALAFLATTALLGTERRPPEWPVPDGPLGEMLAKLPRVPTEKALLQTAGVLGTCHLAGWMPPLVEATLAPAEGDGVLRHSLSAGLQQTLSSIVADGPVRLQAEAFQKLAAAGCGIPYRLLPKALDSGRRSTALRPSLLPVIGVRGAWLAAQNEAWSYAVGSGTKALDDKAWEHGSLDQRRLYLNALRSRDPARARELIAATLTTEGARERTALIECLTTGLSLEDQDLLEASLADKSKEARQVALRLLSSLPQSRVMQRMTARVLPCLTMEKKFLRGTVITLEAPAAYAAEWKSDLIEEAKPKGSAMGERAWWLFQMVGAVPLEWWELHTSMKPEELIAWAQKSDWKDALLKGWAAAQALQKRVPWAEAFLSTEIPAGTTLNPLDLLETLPLPLRETHFLRLFDSTSAKQGAASSALLDRFLAGIPFDGPPLSVATAKQLIRVLKHRMNSGDARYDWQLRSSLVELACVIPAALFDDLANGWDLSKDEVKPFAEAIARLGIVLDQRRQFSHLGSR